MIYQLTTADTFEDGRAPETVVQQLIDRLRLEAQKLGWVGHRLISAEQAKVNGEKMISVSIGPAEKGEVTIDDVRKFVKGAAK